MNLTKSKLKQMVKEEIQKLNETSDEVTTKAVMAMKKIRLKDLKDKEFVRKLAKKYKIDYDVLTDYIKTDILFIGRW